MKPEAKLRTDGPFRDVAAVQFSYGQSAVGVFRRDPGTVRPVVAATA